MKIKLSKSIVLLALATSSASYAADYPSKTITMIVPFAAGGPTDTIARLLAQAMGANLKQQIIVENVGGAGGTLGAGRAARSSPDGYTIFLSITSDMPQHRVCIASCLTTASTVSNRSVLRPTRHRP